MQQLWAPWRISYIKGQKEKGCIFCLKQKSTDDRHSLILSRGDHSFVLMNLYPYNNSHLLISPYKHVESTDQLNIETLNEIIWRTQSTDFWVNFKVFGFMGLTIVFIVTQLPLLKRFAIEKNK